MQNKYAIKLFATVILIALIIFTINFYINSNQDDLHTAINSEYREADAKSELRTSKNKTSLKPSYNRKHVETPREVLEWKEKRLGYYYNDREKRDYDYYSNEQLQKIGDSGDLLALHILFGRYLKSEEFDKARATLAKAAVFGSSMALVALASLPPDTDKLAADNRAVYNLAMTQVAIYRGDFEAALWNNDLINERLSLDQQAKSKIRALAKDIYSQLQAHRVELGLLPFNNELPAHIRRYYDNHPQLQRIKEMGVFEFKVL